jgi:hypothetical protein
MFFPFSGERAREEARGRKQGGGGDPDCEQRAARGNMGASKRRKPRGCRRKYLDPTSSQKDFKVCIAKQSKFTALAPNSST